MKMALVVIAGLLVAGSLAADYLWRRWVDARRAERERFHGPDDRRSL